MTQCFWVLLLFVVCDSARVVKVANGQGDLPVSPPGHEDPNARKLPEPVEQADGKVVQRVSWDVAEDFNLARTRARERRMARMAQQQAAAAKAQAEAEAKVKAAWEKNAYNHGKKTTTTTSTPKPEVEEMPARVDHSATTVVHLIRKPRPHKHVNRTVNHSTNHNQGVKNMSNLSSVSVENPDPALHALDNIAQKVAHFGEALEKFTKAQTAKGKGKKVQKLPPQVEKIMEGAEDLMKKIIAVADDKPLEEPEVDVKSNKTRDAELRYFWSKRNSTVVVKDQRNTTSNQSVSVSSVVSGSWPAQRRNTTQATVDPVVAAMNGTSKVSNTTSTGSKNSSVTAQSSNQSSVSQDDTPVAKNETMAAIDRVLESIDATEETTASKNATKVTDMTDNNANLTESMKGSVEASSTSKNEIPVQSKNVSIAKNATSSTPPTNTTTMLNSTQVFNTGTKNVTQKSDTPREYVVPTHFNKPDRMVHSAMGAARLAAAKLRGMRVQLHKPEPEDDSWKFAKAQIESRIVGLKTAREDAKKAGDQDLADSLQEKIIELSAEANENKAKGLKGHHHHSE